MSSGHAPPPVSSLALPSRDTVCRSAVDPDRVGELRSPGVAAVEETSRNESSPSGAEHSLAGGGEGSTPMDVCQASCTTAQTERPIQTPAERLISQSLGQPDESNELHCTNRHCQLLQSGQYCEECSRLTRQENATTAESKELLHNEHDQGKGTDSNIEKTFDGPMPVMPPPKRARVDDPSTTAMQGSCSQAPGPDRTGFFSNRGAHSIDYVQLRQDIEGTRIRARTLIASKLGTGVLENLCRNLAMLRGDCGASVGDGAEASHPVEPTDPDKEQKRRREGVIIDHLATFVEEVVRDLKRQLPTLSHMELLHRHCQQQSHSQLHNPPLTAGPPVSTYPGTHRPNIPALFNQSIGGVTHEMMQALAGQPPRVSIAGNSMLSNTHTQFEGPTRLAALPGMSYSVNPQTIQPPQPPPTTSTGSLPRFQGASLHPSAQGGMRPIQLLPPRTSKLGQLNSTSIVPTPFPHPAAAVVTSIHSTGILPTQAPSPGFGRSLDEEEFSPALGHRSGVSGVHVPTSCLPGQGLISNGYLPIVSPRTNSHGGEPSQPKDPRLGVIRSEGGDSNGIVAPPKEKHQTSRTPEQNSRLKYLQN